MFNRSGIVFDAKIQQNKGTQRITPEFTAKIYLNQLILVAELCKQLKANTLTITAIQTISKSGLMQKKNMNTPENPTLIMLIKCTKVSKLQL